MAITVPFSGTKAVDTTEWSMVTDTAGPDAETSDGVFMPVFNVQDMVVGDELQFRVYEKVTSGSTQRIVYQQILTGQIDAYNFICPALILMHGWDMTLDAIAGTITVDWAIRKVA